MILQLSRVQSVDVEFSYPRAQESFLTEYTDNSIIERPRVELAVEYLATAGANERAIGLVTNGIHSAFWKLNQEKNYYIQYQDEMVEGNFSSGQPFSVMTIGHAVLNGYSIAGSVGELLRATFTAQGLNCEIVTGSEGEYTPNIDTITAERIPSTFTLPPANSQVSTDSVNTANDISALAANDLLMEFPSGSIFGNTISGDGCLLQSFNLSFSVDRSESVCLGHACPKERRVLMPIQVTLAADAIMNNHDIARLQDLDMCDSGHDINILVRRPCSDELALEFRLRGMKLESQQISNNIDGFQTVSFSWNMMVGNLNDSGNNVYMKSYHGTPSFLLVNKIETTGIDIYGDLGFIEQVYFTRTITERLFETGVY